jgi:hypothetical protein
MRPKKDSQPCDLFTHQFYDTELREKTRGKHKQVSQCGTKERTSSRWLGKRLLASGSRLESILGHSFEVLFVHRDMCLLVKNGDICINFT